MTLDAFPDEPAEALDNDACRSLWMQKNKAVFLGDCALFSVAGDKVDFDLGVVFNCKGRCQMNGIKSFKSVRADDFLGPLHNDGEKIDYFKIGQIFFKLVDNAVSYPG